jgi:NADPH-dependent 2,4-dienoyl-CoA reductase/sulfur reductase-like enzyme
MVELRETEVAVVGAGPAGIAAATTAAEAGAKVCLVDESWSPGGQIWRGGIKGPPSKSKRWIDRLSRSSVECIDRATVVDIGPANELILERDGARIEVGARSLILATGARELFLPFPGWTLPGVIGIGAAQALLKAGLSIRNTPTIVAGTGPLVLPVASALSAAGACLDIVADQVSGRALMRFAASLWRYPGKWVEAARYRLRFLGCSYLTGLWVVSAAGDHRLREVELTDGDRTWRQRCELLCCSYGLVPNIELAVRLGCATDRDRVTVDELQQTSVDSVYAAGESTGIGGVELAVVEGQIAGLAAAGLESIPPRLVTGRDRLGRFAESMGSTFAPRAELRDRLTPSTTICRCEDVDWSQIDPSWDSRQAKLYSRVGMGTCQSRVCGPALSYLCGWKMGSVRPPIKACGVGVLGPEDC